jgi:hypothetical protein
MTEEDDNNRATDYNTEKEDDGTMDRRAAEYWTE